jgi:hypothetical protein
MASELKPFRQYDEHDVINLFTFNGTTGTNGVLLDAGRMVTINGTDGWKADDDQVDLAGNIGSVPNNVLSNSWSLTAKVDAAAAQDTKVIGMTLVAMRDKDENDELLVYHPRKAAEMGVVVPGQSIPLLTRGLVIYRVSTASTGASWLTDAIAAGDPIYVEAGGLLTKDSDTDQNFRVGTALGAKDASGFALLKIEL